MGQVPSERRISTLTPQSHAAALPTARFLCNCTFSSNARSQMLFRFTSASQFTYSRPFPSVSHAVAQREEMSIGDHPGLIPKACR